MTHKYRPLVTVFVFMLCTVLFAHGYPLNGYETTGIRRLEGLTLHAENQGVPIPPGGLKHMDEIHLNLLSGPGAELTELPPVDSDLQNSLEKLFPNRHESYSISLLDITPGQPIRFAEHRGDQKLSPGSVGKLVIAAGLFNELKQRYPDSTEPRQQLLRERMVVADRWSEGDEHEIPVYNAARGNVSYRRIRTGDKFSLYEWVDHMLSASANGAGSVVWKEVMLMHAFGDAYPPSLDEEKAFFAKTPRTELQRIALESIHAPLREVGIAETDWRLGTFFTDAGKAIVPGIGSYASPRALLWFLVRIEQGKLVDMWSSLELKRLMYMTGKRIRYASSPSLAGAAVYFKSGSFYKHRPEPGFTPEKYNGNVANYMNSVAIVEQADGRIYLACLMSNVLRKNSAMDHRSLAAEIDRLLKQ